MRRTILCAVIALVLPSIIFFAFFRKAPDSGPSTDPAESQALQQLSGQFDATANISYKGFDATATISQQSPQSCLVSFTAPSSLDGMTFEFSQDTVSVGYKGLSFGFDPTSLPGDAIAKLAVSAINASLKQDNVALEYTDGALAVMGSTDSGDFTLMLDPDTGSLLKLSVPEQQLEIAFSNFTFLG